MSAAPHGHPDRTHAAFGRARQPQLPATADPLPARTTDEHPVSYQLTARARRVVAPETLPELSVLPSSPAADSGGADAHDGTAGPCSDPFDPRPAQARALRRSGRSIAEIVDRLEASPVLVARWCRDVASRPARRAPTPAAPAGADRVRDERVVRSNRGVGRAGDVAHDRVRGLLETADGPPAALEEVVASAVRVVAATVSVTVAAPDLAAAAVGWLCAEAFADRRQLRVVLEVSDDVAADRAVRRWAEWLGIDPTAITVTVDRAPHREGVRATLRITDPRVATALLAWQKALRTRTRQRPRGGCHPDASKGRSAPRS